MANRNFKKVAFASIILFSYGVQATSCTAGYTSYFSDLFSKASKHTSAFLSTVYGSSKKQIENKKDQSIQYAQDNKLKTSVGVVGALALGYGAYRVGLKKLAFSTVAVITGYIYKFGTHYWQLEKISRAYAESLAPKSVNQFRFATWKIDLWNGPKNILENKITVEKALKEDARKETGGLYVKNLWGQRIDTKAVSAEAIKKAIEQERKALEKELAFVGGLTQVSQQIINQSGAANESLKNSLKNLSFSKKVLMCAEKLFLDKKGSELNVLEKSVKEVLPNYGSSVVFFPSYDPRSWAVAPCHPKATELYWNLFVSYLRLRTIEGIVQNMNFKADTAVSDLINSLNEAKNKIGTLITDRPSVNGNNSKKSGWISNLTDVISIINTASLKEQVCNNKLRKEKIMNIGTFLTTADNAIYQPDQKQNDPIVPALNSARTILENLISDLDKEK